MAAATQSARMKELDPEIRSSTAVEFEEALRLPTIWRRKIGALTPFRTARKCRC
jgi:hypothetical protein